MRCKLPIKIFVLYILLVLSLVTRAQKNTSGNWITAGNLRVHYQVNGQGPALIFLHGGYLDLHSWDSEALYFSKHYKVIRIDLPGHGKTAGIDTNLKVQDVVRILMDKLHISKASLVGLSLGAACVIDFALAYPQRVNKLVLVSSGLSGWPDVMKLDTLSKQMFIHSDSVFESKDPRRIADNFTQQWCDGPYRKPAMVPQGIRNYVWNSVLNNAPNYNAWPVFNKNRAALRVKNIRKPVLIMVGSLDVPFIITVGNFLHRQIPNSQLYTVPGVAHMINLEKPVVFKQMVNGFLN